MKDIKKKMYATLVVVTQLQELGADNLQWSNNILNTKNQRDSYGTIRGAIPNPERATHIGPITTYYLTTTGEGKKLDAALLKRYRKAAAVEEMSGVKHDDNTMIESFASIWLRHPVHGSQTNEKRYVGTLHRTYVPKCVMLEWLEELGWKVEREIGLRDYMTELTIRKV